MRARRWLPLVLFAAACGDPSGMDWVPLESGTYALVSIAERPIPTPEPCSGTRIVEERYELDDARGVRYHQHGIARSGETVTLTGNGSYETHMDGRVEIDMTLDLQTGSYRLTTYLERTPDGLTAIVGLPCDARDIKLYRLQR